MRATASFACPGAKFITADVMLRLHQILGDMRQSHDCGGWTKQSSMAKSVATFTGVPLRAVDAEYIGNAQDTFLRDYRKAFGKRSVEC